MKKVTKITENKGSKVALKKIRVAAYCRVSTDSDAQLKSLEAQKTHYENYITSRDDWEFAGLYFDEGITGTKKDKRPELLRLARDCKAGKIDFVITKSISRFSRNTTDCLGLVRKLLALHIPVFFEKEKSIPAQWRASSFWQFSPAWPKENRFPSRRTANGQSGSASRMAPLKSAIRPMDTTGMVSRWLSIRSKQPL